MAKKVIIKNIKHIQNLEFDLPSKSGVYTLTGSNGSGKTTLMTCLLRIGWYRAFQDYFKTGKGRFDLYSGEIIYQVGEEKVSYHHAGTRWPPRPKRNSHLFSGFGYPEVRFLPATGNRLFIHEDEITTASIRAVSTELKNDLNDLLETTKFNDLRYVQTGSVRGPGSGSQRWKRAYVIKKGTTYYSEKNFSLGEILILNTLLLIDDVSNGSMLLIDELEMALHPRVQIKLLKYLNQKAKVKNLTVILSTHSSSLIKSSERLIYLENNGDGNIIVQENCYPTMILKEVAIEEDIQPDYVFTVEDDMAEMLLKEMLKYYFRLEPSQSMPVYKVLPIGGYQQVLEFSNHSRDYLFHSKIGQYLFLDADVEEVKNNLRRNTGRDVTEQKLFELFNALEQRTNFLPITPELGVWNWITTETRSVQERMNSHYNDSTFNLRDLVDSTNSHFPTDSDSERKKAKRRLKHLVKLLEGRINEDSKRINQFLFKLFVEKHYAEPTNLVILKRIFGQIFNTRGNRDS
jgi:energy-coupling factor transporter ATP-binding protein EcfA2